MRGLADLIKPIFLSKRFLKLAAILAVSLMILNSIQPVTITQAQSANYKIYMPFISNEQVVYQYGPAIYTTSYYMKSADSTASYNLGCQLGTRDAGLPGAQDDLVILDYGQPIYDLMNGSYQYGTFDFAWAYLTVDQIAFSVERFAEGYYICTGKDYTSRLKIGIGTSNYGGLNTTCPECAVNAAHGKVWATMVNSVNAWIVSKQYSGQVSAVGANDIELTWNTYAKTRDWLDGYDSANQYELINYGAVEGCPSPSHLTWQCNNNWTQENVWYAVWGAPAVYPLPEIYANDGINAEQWYWVSVYAYVNHGLAINFAGVLTQKQSCGSECTSLGNTPQQGWSQLQNLLNSDSRTVDPLHWSTDIAYQ